MDDLDRAIAQLAAEEAAKTEEVAGRIYTSAQAIAKILNGQTFVDAVTTLAMIVALTLQQGGAKGDTDKEHELIELFAGAVHEVMHGRGGRSGGH